MNMKDPILVHDRVRPILIQAMRAAVCSHGNLTADHTRALSILMEEVGETAAEVLSYTRAKIHPVTTVDHYMNREALIIELSQVASVALFMIDNLLDERAAEERKVT